jgi:hypothetical protein
VYILESEKWSEETEIGGEAKLKEWKRRKGNAAREKREK